MRRQRPPTVWDTFYGHAMAGMLAAARYAPGEQNPTWGEMADDAADIADMMVKHRRERGIHGEDDDEEEDREEEDREARTHETCPTCRRHREEGHRLGEAIAEHQDGRQ